MITGVQNLYRRPTPRAARSTPVSRTLGRLLSVLGLALLVLSAGAGCGGNELESPTAARLRGLATLYLEYAVAKNGQGPAGEAVFKKHLRNQPGFILQMNGLDPDALDTAFASERD